MSYHSIDSFNWWMGHALSDLGDLPTLPRHTYPMSRKLRTDLAATSVRHALRRANEMGCPARKAMCLRILNWLNADARRAS